MEGGGTAAVSLPMFRQVTTLPVPSSLGFLDDHGLHGMRTTESHPQGDSQAVAA